MDAAAIVEALMTTQGRTDPYPLYAEAHQLGPVPGPRRRLVPHTGLRGYQPRAAQPGVRAGRPDQPPDAAGRPR